MSDTTQPKSLEDLVKEQLASRQTPVEPKKEEAPVDDKASETTSEVVDSTETEPETTTVDDSQADSDVQDTKEPAKPTESNGALEFLRQEFYELGYDKAEVDALSLDELKREYRLLGTASDEPEPEPEPARKKSKRKPEPEDEVEDEPEAPKGETAKERQIRLAKLGYDPSLEAYVEFKNGVAIPKADTGDRGEKAAEKINEWAEAYRQRQRLLVEDPVGTLAPDIQEIIKEQVSKALAEYDQTLQGKAQEVAKANAQVREQQAVADFWAKHDKEFFVTDENGQLRKSIKSKTYIPTERGQQFEKIFNRLSATSQAPASVVLNQALELLNEFSPAATKKVTRDERKKEFLDKGRTNKATQLTEAAQPAKPSEKAATKGAKVSLLEAMVAKAELSDNPFLSELRRQQGR